MAITFKKGARIAANTMPAGSIIHTKESLRRESEVLYCKPSSNPDYVSVILKNGVRLLTGAKGAPKAGAKCYYFNGCPLGEAVVDGSDSNFVFHYTIKAGEPQYDGHVDLSSEERLMKAASEYGVVFQNAMGAVLEV